MVPSNTVFSVFAFLGFILVTIPLPWHLQSWNTGTCLYILWTSFGCLTQFINSVVWRDNVINWAPAWCDITSHFIIGSSVGIPASSLCIIRRLYQIATIQSLNRSKEERRRDIIVDLSIGIVFPCIVMALAYIVQGHRFDIYEQLGCYPFTLDTTPAYPLVLIWPVVIGLISAVYAALTFIAAFRGKARLNALLRTSCQISTGRYWRLMALSGVEILCTVPLGVRAIILDYMEGVMPWPGWADVHYDFSRVGQVPAAIWQDTPSAILGLELTRWLYVLCAFVFFAFFGFAEESRMEYRRIFLLVVRRLGYSPDSSPVQGHGRPTTNGGPSLLPFFQSHKSKQSSISQLRPMFQDKPSSLSKPQLGDIVFASRETENIPSTLPEYSPSSSSLGSVLPLYHSRSGDSPVPHSPVIFPQSIFDRELPPIPNESSQC